VLVTLALALLAALSVGRKMSAALPWPLPTAGASLKPCHQGWYLPCKQHNREQQEDFVSSVYNQFPL